jgi:hypothetical protein
MNKDRDFSRREGMAVSLKQGGSDNKSKLIAQYGYGSVKLTGAEEAPYERHLLFDNVVDASQVSLRARSLRYPYFDSGTCETALSGEQLEFETRSRSHFSASRFELAQARAALVSHARLLESSACLFTKQSDRQDQPDSLHLPLHLISEP